jgi:hypothetical protein
MKYLLEIIGLLGEMEGELQLNVIFLESHIQR